MIFGQHDHGKNPYNSWGKPVRKFFILFYEYCFFSDVEIYTTKKLQQLRNRTYLENHAKLHLDFRADKTEKIQQKLQPSKLYEQPRKQCWNGCTASLEICSFLSSRFVPTWLKLRALPCCTDLLKVSVAALLLLTAQKILFNFLLLLLSICS